MINLDTSKWKEFKLVDYFNIDAGKYHYSSEYENGNTPYVSASNIENAIAERISLEPDFKGNKITTGKVGCTAFYQEEDFCATSDVNIFTPLFEMNRYVGLFIATVINFNENYKWGYGRQCRVGDSKEIIVKLPTTEEGKPDFDFMEKYMKSIWGGSHYTSIPYSKNDLNINEWKEFEIGELFKLTKCKCNCASNLEDGKETIYIGAKKNNNGFMKFVKNEPKLSSKGNCLVFICDGEGSVGYSNYLDRDFIGSTTVTCGYNENLNKYIGMFLVTVLDLEKVRYSYGRKYSPTLAKTKIKLPIDSNGNPDWKHMENYIKKLQFSDMI